MLRKTTFILAGLFITLCTLGQSNSTHINSGLVKFDKKDYKGAVKDYDQAIKLNPKSGRAYHYRAKAKASLKDYYGALDDLTRAIKLSPKSDKLGAYYFSRAVTKTLLNEYHSSIKDFDMAIKHDPSNSEFYLFKGFIYLNLDKKKEACKCWKDAKELSIEGNADAELMFNKHCK